MGVVGDNNGTCHLRIIGHTQVIAPLAASELLVGPYMLVYDVSAVVLLYISSLS